MESISLEKREVVLDILQQIKESIENLMEWNHGITDMNQLLMSPSGIQDLAGNCMTIMAIGEGFRKIDKITGGNILQAANIFVRTCRLQPAQKLFAIELYT